MEEFARYVISELNGAISEAIVKVSESDSGEHNELCNEGMIVICTLQSFN